MIKRVNEIHQFGKTKANCKVGRTRGTKCSEGRFTPNTRIVLNTERRKNTIRTQNGDGG